MKAYMVQMTLPPVLTEKFLNLIPQQRQRVDELFSEGKLSIYSLALDRSTLWAVFEASTKSEVEGMIHSLPLSKYMQADIVELAFHNKMSSAMPAIHLN